MYRKELTRRLLARVKASIKERYATDEVHYIEVLLKPDCTKVKYTVKGKEYYFDFYNREHTEEVYEGVERSFIWLAFHFVDKDLK